MNALEINNIVKQEANFRLIFRGVFTVKSLNYARQKYRATEKIVFIVNTTTSPSVLGHYLLLYFYPDRCCIFFDSLAFPLSDYSQLISNFISEYATNVTENVKRIQGNSCVCALYALYFEIHLSRGYKLQTLLSWFSNTRLKLNDEQILIWTNTVYKAKLSKARLLACKNWQL